MQYIVQRLKSGAEPTLMQVCLVDSDARVLDQRSWIYTEQETVGDVVINRYPDVLEAQAIYDMLASQLGDTEVYTPCKMPRTYDKDILTALITSQIMGQSNPD